jgi:hypothetical protein
MVCWKIHHLVRWWFKNIPMYRLYRGFPIAMFDRTGGWASSLVILLNYYHFISTYSQCFSIFGQNPPIHGIFLSCRPPFIRNVHPYQPCLINQLCQVCQAWWGTSGSLFWTIAAWPLLWGAMIRTIGDLNGISMDHLWDIYGAIDFPHGIYNPLFASLCPLHTFVGCT